MKTDLRKGKNTLSFKEFFNGEWYKDGIRQLCTDGWPTFVVPVNIRIQEMLDELDQLQAQLTQERESFKNFHRLICEASGYTHDNIDWKRDQASLAEHIRAKYAKGESE